MGVIRLPLPTTLLVMLVLSGLTAARADQWTFGPPPVADPSAAGRSPATAQTNTAAPLAGRSATAGPKRARPAQHRTEAASFQTPAAEPTPAAAEAASRANPSDLADDTGEELMPIAAGDEFHGDWMPPLDAPAPTSSSGKWFNRGCWYTREDVTFLDRFERKETRLSTDFSSSVTATRRNRFATTRDLGFAPGARLTIGRFLGRDPMNRQSAVEFTFFGLNHWQDRRSLQSLAPNSLFTDFDPVGNTAAGFDRSNLMQYVYASRFDSYELNLILARRLGRDRMVLTRSGVWERNLSPSFLPTLLGGLRLVTVNETFLWNSQGTNPAAVFGQYNVRTHNSMVGFQFGTDFTYQQVNWNAGVRVKGGPFINYADQTTFVHQVDTTVGSPADRNQSAQRTPLAMLGEITVQGSYFFRPNMALRMSYDMLFLTDLALADKQIVFSQMSPNYISASHGLIITGVTAGFEFNW